MKTTWEMISGTLIWYYFICKRAVWYSGHKIGPERDFELLKMGKYIENKFYQKEKRNVVIDGKVQIDLIRNNQIVAEVKKSSWNLKSSIMQLSFYLYYLKHLKGILLKGEILIPEEKKIIKVELTEEKEQQLEIAMKDIQNILNQEIPPSLKKVSFCKVCSYRAYCWSDEE